MPLELNDIDTASLLLESDFYDHYFYGYFLSDNGETFKKFVRKKDLEYPMRTYLLVF